MSTVTKRTTKCGVCRQTGHNKRTCPQAALQQPSNPSTQVFHNHDQSYNQQNWDSLLLIHYNGLPIIPLSQILPPHAFKQVLHKLSGVSLQKAQQVIDKIFEDPLVWTDIRTQVLKRTLQNS